MNPIILRRLVGGGSSTIPLSEIQALFASGEKGGVYDLTDKSTLFQNSNGTTAVTASGQPFGYAADLSGLGNHATQSTSGNRPLYQQCGDFDGAGDFLQTASIDFDDASVITIIVSLKLDAEYLVPPGCAMSVYRADRQLMILSGLGSTPFGVHRAGNSYIKDGVSASVKRTVTFTSDITRTDPALELEMRVDGSDMTLAAFGSPSNIGAGNVIDNATIVLGKSMDWGETINGRIYRVIVINRALTSGELSTAEQWVTEEVHSSTAGYTANINFFHVSGQSLSDGQGSGANITTSQEYDNLQFPKWSDTPTAWEVAAADSSGTGLNEAPSYGALGHINELIDEDSIDPLTDDYKMLTCRNGVGSYSIAVLGKTQVPFDRALTQITAGKSIATTAGKTFKFRGTMWVQGEADDAMSRSAYKGYLRQLALDYSDMGRSITGQEEEPILVTSQVSTNPSPNVALAQLDASIELPIIYLSTPVYPFDFSPDKRHLTAESSKLLGGYMGLVYKRVIIDGVDWSPVRPLSYVQAGSDVTISMHVPVAPLELDTTLLPAQTNYGFAAFNSGGTPISISSVTLVDSDKVKITTASAIPSGGYITYAQSAQPDPARSDGGCGNLRDSQGDTLTYISKPMHNWCVIFTQVIS